MTAAPARSRLLLVEDDASIRRFVCLALEDDPLDVVEAPTLAAAIEALRGAPFDVVLCDLMLPDGSGLELLRALGEPGAPSARARRVAFSAGVSAPVRQQLQQIGVHDVLGKPVSLADLAACVQSALAAPSAEATAQGAPAVSTAEDPQQAIDRYFGGDAALYTAFRAQCLDQFVRDAAAGDLALQAQDLPALRLLSHSLKTVLLSLGHGADSQRAAQLEDAAAAGRAAPCASLWPAMALRLRLLAAG